MSSGSATTIASSSASETDNERTKLIRDAAAHKESTRLIINASSVGPGKGKQKKVDKPQKGTEKGVEMESSIGTEAEEAGGNEAKDSKKGTSKDRYYIKCVGIKGVNCYIRAEVDMTGNPLTGKLHGYEAASNSGFIWTIEYNDDGTALIYNDSDA